jgi:poly(A) polymerase
MRSRACVLQELQRLVLQWIYEVSVQQGMDTDSAKMTGGKIFTFGSYRLGLVGPGSDIDALCVAPTHISRESFFQVLVPKLQEHQDISQLTPVPDAYVPIIKMKLSGVEIDLLFARTMLPQIPENLSTLNDDDLLKNLDDKTVRSLNGCRVADHILQLVPNAETFRETLRLIKIWAKNRGLYSNVMGYFGGITWAILVARVCQLWPHASPSYLVKRFFRVYDRWNWKSPVVLCEIREESDIPGLMQFKVWNPKTRPADRMHLMPVITPAFPSMNSTHNVSETTRRVLQEELSHGYRVMEELEKGRCTWPEVYRPVPFFSQFRLYLQIEVLAKNPTVFTKWFGWIESKLRHLVKQIEQIPHIQVRPWPNHLSFQDPEWPHGTAVFMGLSLSKKGPSLDLRPTVKPWIEMINAWHDMQQHTGLCEMRVRHVNRRDLPSYVPEDLSKPRAPKRTASDTADGNLGLKRIASDVPAEAPSKRTRVEAPDASVALPAASVGLPVASAPPAALAPSAAQVAVVDSVPPVATPVEIAPPVASDVKAAAPPMTGIVDQSLAAECLTAEVSTAPVVDAAPAVTQAPTSSGLTMKRGKGKITVKLQ